MMGGEPHTKQRTYHAKFDGETYQGRKQWSLDLMFRDRAL
jgi:hypothetical protein